MQTKSKRTLRTALAIAAALLIIALAAFYFLKKDLAKPPGQSVVKPVLADQLKKMIREASDSLYSLSFSFFDINTEKGTGIIRHLQLLPDSAVYRKLVALKKAPNSLFDVRIDSMVITHFSFEKENNGKKLVIDDVIIQNPFVTINCAPQPYSDSLDVSGEKTVLTAMKDVMKFSSIRNLTMHNLNLTMTNGGGNQKRSTSIRHLNITAGGIGVTTIKDSSRERMALTIEKSRLATPDSLYFLNTESLRYAPATASVFIKKTELQPRLNKTEFYAKAKFRKDRYHFIQNDIELTGIDINRLLRKQQIYIRSLNIGSSYTEIYTDYNYAKRKPPVRAHSDPHERLQRLAFDITIDTINLYNGTTEYAIKADKSDDVAVFKIDKGENVITNLTNNAAAKQGNHFAVSHFKGRLMNGGTIESVMRFDLIDKNGAFTISTTLGAMDGKLFNPLTKPLALTEIRSLAVQKMNAVIHGNAYRGKGNIDLYYKDMKIALLKKEKKSDDYKKKGLLSFVSNLFAPDDNPNRRGKFRKGPIDVKRNPTDSFFGFIWQCNLKGITVFMTGLDKQ